jgi:hypothetical protein
MNETLNEKVSVITIYDREKGTITPWRIKWNGKSYQTKKIGYYHKIRVGRGTKHIFSVTDGNMFFRLSLDSETLIWTLEQISDGFVN